MTEDLFDKHINKNNDIENNMSADFSYFSICMLMVIEAKKSKDPIKTITNLMGQWRKRYEEAVIKDFQNIKHDKTLNSLFDTDVDTDVDGMVINVKKKIKNFHDMTLNALISMLEN